jgi:hypothetical protein
MTTTTKMTGARLATAAGAVVAAVTASGAQALSFDLGDSDWQLDLDTLVSFTTQWRVAKQDGDKFEYRPGDDIVDFNNKINADDGNRNFSRGPVQNRLSAVVDLKLNWRDSGLFARGRAWYDDVYDQSTDHDERGYLTYNSAETYGGDAAFREFPKGTVDDHRTRLEMLDYYLYTSGDLPGERLYDLRLGSQVINWGEATFYQGINGLQNRIDVIAANTPGVEVKEILMPTGALYGQLDLLTDLTLEAYYQYEWKKTDLNGVGSYFSTQDFLGPAATNFLVAFGVNPETGEPTFILPVPRTADDEASDSGQYGVALHYVTEGGTDFGLYYVNAHSKTPAFTLNYAGIIPKDYTISYFEDIQGVAASFTTVWGITNVQGEVSYKTDVAVVNAAGNPEPGDVIAAQLGGSHVLTPTALWDDANVTFEVAMTKVDSHDGNELRYDSFAWAYALRAELSYLNVIPGLDLRLIPFLQHTINGSVLEANMIDGAKSFNLALRGTYLNNFTAQVGYTAYFGGGQDHLLTDRDNVSLSVSYSF